MSSGCMNLIYIQYQCRHLSINLKMNSKSTKILHWGFIIPMNAYHGFISTDSSWSPKFVICTLVCPFRIYNFDFSFPMSFSSLSALPMSPEILSLPVMKAVVGLREPENILEKLLPSMVKVASGVDGESPFPQAPLPFLRSMYHLPASSPDTSKANTDLVFSTSSGVRKVSIWVNTCNTKYIGKCFHQFVSSWKYRQFLLHNNLLYSFYGFNNIKNTISFTASYSNFIYIFFNSLLPLIYLYSTMHLFAC